MTTIAFGGGPNIEQRRSFAALKDGAHVPGYQGYCPQLKYKVGKTYGDDTYELAKANVQFRHPVSILAPIAKEMLKNTLPEATGDNKYTQNIVPGYTGYIPRKPFKFGNTYKEDCDFCIDEYMTNRRVADFKQADLKAQVVSYPKMTAVSHDPQVRDLLNLYRDTHPRQPLLQEDKRAWTEPPIPGYQGYIPRIQPTELGLGCRYNQSTKKGLEAFRAETLRHANMHRENTSDGLTQYRNPELLTAKTVPSFSRRLYMNNGMIPKYTGYVPQRRYAFGMTYGDTTRSLEVCAHPKTCYGEHVKVMGY